MDGGEELGRCEVSEELKPCMCGEEIYSEFYSHRAEEFDGHCTNKKCVLYGKELLFVNVERWNKRPIEDQLRAENERLRAIIDVSKAVVTDAENQAEARLHAEVENERLRVALREIANSAGIDACGYTTGEGHSDCVWKARHALEGRDTEK